MATHTDRPSRRNLASGRPPTRQRAAAPHAPLADQRPEAAQLARLSSLSQASPQVGQLRAQQARADAGVRQRAQQARTGAASATEPTASPAIPAAHTQAPAASADASTLAGQSIAQVLSGPPALNPRDAQQKQADVDHAAALARRIIGQSGSLAQVEAFFPALRHRFGLVRAEFVKLGQPGAALEVQVNPSARVQLGGSGLTLNNPTASLSGLTQDIRFTTGTLGGDTVGVDMEAHALGPTHPQGGPPGSGALSGIMAQLPTNPALSGDKKFIKGHLLNDNLGGPGVAENLYPITAQANKNHEAYVESWVKQKVNLQGHWVYYRVHAKEQKKDLSGSRGNNYVNADFECEAQLLDALGQKTGSGIHYTIQSRYQWMHLNSKGAVTGDPGAGKAVQEPGFDKDKVEWSTTKDGSVGPKEMDEEIRVAVRQLLDLASSKKVSIPDVRGALAGMFGINNDSLELEMLVDPALDMEARFLDETRSTDVAQWNRVVGVLDLNKTEIINRLGQLETELHNRPDPSTATKSNHRASRHGHSGGIRKLALIHKYRLKRTKTTVQKNLLKALKKHGSSKKTNKK